jgi:hypothetical protein
MIAHNFLATIVAVFTATVAAVFGFGLGDVTLLYVCSGLCSFALSVSAHVTLNWLATEPEAVPAS